MRQFRRSGSRERQRQAAPKPFDFVPLPRRVNRKRPTGHDSYRETDTHITGKIIGTITALSPIHIGSGVIDIGQDGELIKTAVRTGENVVIPGSSLKGAIRSIVEAISESCICKVSRDTRYAMPKDFSECRQKDRLCVACRMFGAMGFQSNIAIQDAPQIEGQVVTKRVPELYRPRQRRGIRHVPGRKFYKHGEVATGETPVEACEKGSKFRFVVQVDNLTQAEWGLFLTSLGHHTAHPFKIKIGGAKPVCFGSIDIEIEEVQIEEQNRQRYLDWNVQSESARTGERLDTWKSGCINAAMESLIQEDLLTKLAEILSCSNEQKRNCPSGLY